MLPVKLGILPKRSNGLGGEVKGWCSGKQYCRQGKAVEIPVWVCLTAPTGGVASGFLRHWTGPASSTQEFQGFNIYLKTISSDMVHGLARVRTVTNMGSISFLLLLLLGLITTGFYILTFGMLCIIIFVGASSVWLLLCNASLVHCFLVLGAIYFWCCIFDAMHCQLHCSALLPQWRIYFIW